MKNLIITSIVALLLAGWSIAGAQNNPDEYLGLPGDNLNLYAVMKMFQESETLEDFEKNLNNENTMINNLDLNGDNLVDYIMVLDYQEGDFHSIVLRVALDERETQDVAVFTVQRYNDGTVGIQLIGDEALYGKNYIIEPYYAESNETPNPGYIGNATPKRKVAVVRTTTYEVATWPIVLYIYRPAYVAWRSSWYWGYYPGYWNPWRPFYWHTYYGYHSHWHNHYHAHYRVWNHYRYPRYNNYYYTNIRKYSPRVTVNINNGVYRTTYSRPDLRRQGEVLYARKNSGRNSETLRNSTDSRVRTDASTSVQRSRTNGSSSVERQSVSTSARRSANQPAVNQRTDVTRKSGTVTNNRNSSTSRSSSANVDRSSTSTRSAGANSNSTVRSGKSVSQKSAKISTNRTESRPSVRSSAGTSKRSTPAVSNRSVTKSQAAPKVSSSRSSSSKPETAVSRGNSSTGNRSTTAGSRSSGSSSTRSSGRR